MYSQRLTGVVVFLAGMLFYTVLAVRLAPMSLATNNAIFGADTVEIAHAMTHLTFDGDMHRHPLFSLVTAPLTLGLMWLPLIDEHRAVLLTIGIVAAGNLALAWWVLSRLVHPLLALGLTALYGVCFSNLVLWSIPETYALSGIMVTAFIAVFLWHREHPTVLTGVILGAVVGLAGLANPPLMSLLVIIAVYEWRHGFQCIGDGVVSVACLAMTCSTAFLVFGIGYAATAGTAGVEHTVGTAEKWGAFGNLLDPMQWIFVAATFFAGAIVSPVSLRSDLFLGDFTGYLHNPLPLLAVSIFFGLSLCGLYHTVKARDPFLWPILSWVTVMYVFYVYFNPHEAMLYSSQCLFPLLVLVARGLDSMTASVWRKVWVSYMTAFCIFIANLTAF